MAITGAHVLLFSPEAEAVRATLRDVIGWDFVEAHPGWLIFGLPPAELGVHPSDGDTRHELWLICDDLDATVDDLRGKGVEFTGEPSEEDFGRSVRLRLPGGVEVPLYEPKHALAIDI
ncbi:MAG: extradiol dioxygenase [Actinobacteria bacterium]|nr:MAG: extradiol dioxygenase [Actinomycetota bacterium]